MSDLRLVHSTIDTREAALELARTIVDENLAGCVNVGGESVTSVYHWDGELQEEAELTLTLKTTRDRVEDLIKRLDDLHPYDCPEILVTKVENASESYETWVKNHCG